MISSKDIKIKKLPPGEGAMLIISGESAAELVAEADKRGENASDMVMQALQEELEKGE